MPQNEQLSKVHPEGAGDLHFTFLSLRFMFF